MQDSSARNSARRPESRSVDYLILGGGVAGGHAVFEIRKHDKSGRVLMVNQEKFLPYDRPPLSKEYMAGKMKRGEVFFRADSYYKREKVQAIKERRVARIDTATQNVTLDDGSEFSYKALLIATGGTVKKLKGLPGSDLGGIYYLRTIDDCDVIKKAATSDSKTKKHAAIVGGGFIGCEVAATLKSRGLDVTLIHKSPHLLSSAIDEETAEWVKEYHSKKGVNVLTNSNVTGFVQDKDGRVGGVELEGRKGNIECDFVVVGIGIAPAIELAQRAGIKVDEGILVNENLMTGADHVFAAGDVAKFYSPIFKRNLRIEHVDVAQKQGAIAGANMVSSVKGRKRKTKFKSFDELPYFFSYQYDLEINAYGDLSDHTAVIRRGELDPKNGFIQFYFGGSILNGILSVNADEKDIEKAKGLLRKRAEIPDPSILSDSSRSMRSLVQNIKR